MTFLNLPDSFGYVLLIDALIAIQIIIIGFVVPMGSRKKMFTEEFLRDNFGKQHTEAFGQELKGEGYPDMGSGRYSQKLTYKQWFEFNSAQRAHYNFVEWIASTLALVAISGIYFPIPAASLGLAMFIGRIIYTAGYVSGGPKGRTVGALINDLGFLGVMVLSIISSVFYIVGRDI